jgi:hypothetical protein
MPHVEAQAHSCCYGRERFSRGAIEGILALSSEMDGVEETKRLTLAARHENAQT